MSSRYIGAYIAGFLSLILIVLLTIKLIGPEEPSYPASVTQTSPIVYSIGEKLKAKPFTSDDWYDGTVKAITSDDEYVVEFCGNIGWFDKYECNTESLLRSQLAKTQFDHSQCQYPDRTTNPSDGCDNSDPCNAASAAKGGSGTCE